MSNRKLSFACLLFGLFCVTCTNVTEPNVFIVVPSEIYAEQDNYISLRTNLHASKFKLKTQLSRFNETLLAEEEHALDRQEDGWYGAQFLYRSPIISTTTDPIAIKMNFTDFVCAGTPCNLGDGVNSATAETDVLHWPLMLLGESEKPMYRPGETVRLRFIILKPQSSVPVVGPISYPRKKLIKISYDNAELQDWTEEDERNLQTPRFSEIYVMDSKKQRVKQWLDVSPLMAANLNFSLLKDAPEGEWSVVAKTVGHRDETVSFTVRHYVLPRFVTNFVFPDNLSFESNQTQFSVCANYTNGPPLSGSVRAHFCVCSESPRNNNDTTIIESNHCPKEYSPYGRLRPCVESFGILQEDGCARFNVSTEKLKLRLSDYPKWSQVPVLCASVEEEGTEFVVNNCDRGTKIKRRETELEINVPFVYKHGLPVSGSIHLKHSNPLKATNASIKLRLYESDGGCLPYGRSSMRGSSDRYAHELDVLTDAFGVAKFIIPPIISEKQIEVEAVYDPMTLSESEKTMRVNQKRRVMPTRFLLGPDPFPDTGNIRKTASIYPWQTKSNVSVQQWTEDTPLRVECPGNVTVVMLANTPLNNRIIHVQTMVRGKFLHHRIEPAGDEQSCTDQNGTLGHYTCLDGEKIKCHAGWTGPDCLQPICAPSCHHVGGRCGRPNECRCIRGWNGTNCDQCQPREGCEHGKCVQGDDCVCDERWIGYACNRKKIDYEQLDDTPVPSPPLELPETIHKTRFSSEVKRTLYTRRITFAVDGDWGPEANVVMFFYHDGDEAQREIIPMVIKLEGLDNCTSPAMSLNAVDKSSGLQFDRYKAAPGEQIQMYIRPSGLSEAVSSVIASNDDQLNDQLCFTRISDIALDNFEGYKNAVSLENIQSMMKSMVSRGTWRPDVAKSVADSFRYAGLQLSTLQAMEYILPTYRCLMRSQAPGPEMMYFASSGPMQRKGESSRVEKPRLRDFFPEVWLFDVMPMNLLDEDDSNPVHGVHKQLTTPDSITTWRASVYCTTKQNGLWIPQPKEITVSMPFYVELTLPKEVKRGEILYLPISVFVTPEDVTNQEQKKSCYEVTVTTDVDQKEWSYVGPSEYSGCVCEGEKRTFQLGLLPRKIGKLNVTAEAHAMRNSPMCDDDQTFVINSTQPRLADRQRRQIRVVPEGVPKETSIGELLCISSDQQIIEKSFQLGYPKYLVEGSLRTYWSYTDEVFGRAIGNLDRLVRLPMGCGEQNMLLVAPNVYVLDYLTSVPSVNQAQTEKLVKSARKHIVTGYNRQLKYRHKDGSYSAFGQSDGEGSTWLTAFVLRVFAKARHVNSEIDVNWGKLFNETSKFLQSRQNISGSGCFEERGRVIHTEMQGGLSKDAGDKLDIRSQILTSYIIAALHEMPVNYQWDLNETYKHARRCVIPMDKIDKISTYELAQLAYTMRRTQPHSDTTVELQKELIKRSRGSNVNTLYWITPYPPPTSAYDVKAVDIETTSYAYLSLVGDLLTRADALSVIRWLTAQQNPNGGFKSTQDTVLALEAISDFAKRVGLNSSSVDSAPIDIHARINPSGHQLVRKLTPETRRVLNTVELPTIHPMNATEVTWKIKSTTPNSGGCLAVQTIQYYNVHESKSGRSSPFRLMFDIEQRSTPPWDTCIKPKLTVCLQMSVDPVNHYDSGMLLIRIHMVSGWTPSSENLLKSMGNATESIRRLEFDDMGIVSVYFNGFTANEAKVSGGWSNIKRCVQLNLEQTNFVHNTQPAQIMAMDYYATERSASTEYVLSECKGAWGIDDEEDSSSTTTGTTEAATPRTTLSTTLLPLVCPSCTWSETSNTSLVDIMLDWICTGYNNLFVFTVLSKADPIYTVSVTKFGSSNYVSKWNATLNETTCDCASLKPKANLIYLAPESLNIMPGQPELSIISRQADAMLLDVSNTQIRNSIQTAAEFLNIKKNSTDVLVDRPQFVRWACGRLSTLEKYIRVKLI